MDDPQNACIADGEADIYGMGIRVGLYLQWTSTLFSFFFIPDTFLQLLVANYCFSTAVSIAYLVNRSGMKSHEVPIVAMLLTMTLIMIPLEMLYFLSIQSDSEDGSGSSKSSRDGDSANLDPAHQEAGGSSSRQPPAAVFINRIRKALGDHISAISAVAWFISTTFLLAVLGWQYWNGTREAETLPGCRPKLLGSYYLERPYAIVLKGGYIVLAFLIGAMIVLFTIAKLTSGHHKKKKQKTALGSIVPKFNNLPEKTRNNLRRSMAAVFGLLMAFSVAYIETAIYQNKIKGVNAIGDAGQIIPLIIGVASFLFLLYEILQDVLTKKNSPPSSRRDTFNRGTGTGTAAPELEREGAVVGDEKPAEGGETSEAPLGR